MASIQEQFLIMSGLKWRTYGILKIVLILKNVLFHPVLLPQYFDVESGKVEVTLINTVNLFFPVSIVDVL